jgi:hypothetical protein
MFARPRTVDNIDTCYFYHTMNLPIFGLQDGGWDLRGRFDDYIGHVNLTNMRVLDVGTASGFLSFSSEQRGAREVVSFDLDTAARQHVLPFREGVYYRDHEAWCRNQSALFDSWKNAYWLSHHLLGSRAKAFYGDVYDIPSQLGPFDVVIAGAILEHLSDPIRALASISKVANDWIVVNTDFIDDDEPVARFNGRPDRPENDFVFWTYSFKAYEYIFAILGFKIVRVEKHEFLGMRPSKTAARPSLPRAAIVAQRIS